MDKLSDKERYMDIDLKYSEDMMDNTVKCPACDGYGQYNVELDAYGKGRHFQVHCAQCIGWGWVEANSIDAICIHEYSELTQEKCAAAGIRHLGKCFHVYECRICGITKSHDSSD